MDGNKNLQGQIMEINFITSNNGKAKSLERSLINANRLDVKINQVNLDIIEPQLDSVAEVSKYKALEAFKILKRPVLVEDGGLSIPALKGFPGVYTKYVLATIGVDGILKLMCQEEKREAKFVSFTTFIGNDGIPYQFERHGDNFEIARTRKCINRVDAWSDIWQIMYMKDYGKMFCEFSEQELIEHSEKSSTSGSLQQFTKWFLEKY